MRCQLRSTFPPWFESSFRERTPHKRGQLQPPWPRHRRKCYIITKMVAQDEKAKFCALLVTKISCPLRIRENA